MTTLHQHLRRVEEAEACWDRCAAEAAAIIDANDEETDAWRARYQEYAEAGRDVPQHPGRDQLVAFITEHLTEE